MESWRSYWPVVLIFVLIMLHESAVISSTSENILLPLWEIDFKMPGVRPTKSDAYVCASYELPDTEAYIVKFEPLASQNTVHHLLVYSCGAPASSKPFWDCGSMIGTCADYNKEQIIYAWAKNAPPLSLPKDVGFKVSGSTGRKYIVMQLHFAHPFAEGVQDHSGVKMMLTTQRQLYLAGIFLLGAWMAKIPPNSTGVHVDVACHYSSEITMHAFAFRPHTHTLGRVVSGYRVRNGEWTLLGKGNPQAPQEFYPMDNIISIRHGDYLTARCTYDSTSKPNTVTSMGATAADEMCNFYIMYYTQSSQTVDDEENQCWDNENKELVKNFPAGSDTPVSLPPGVEPVLHDHDNHLHEDGPMVHMHHHESEEDNSDSISSPGDIHSGDGIVKNTDDHDSKDTQSTENENGISPTPQTVSAHIRVVQNWSESIQKELGQVAGVSLNSNEEVLIFHRANRIWNGFTFDKNNVLIDAEKLGPIKEPTIWTIHPQTGQVINKWGKDLFYIPHGLTIDHQDNLWLTDVGLHQVFKFSNTESNKAELTLGEKLTPGQDDSHFCQPTSVAVDSLTGEFFVADGYCNGRIMKFKKDGKFLMKWGKPSEYQKGLQVAPPSTFYIPHKLSLDKSYGQLYVADRENNRIQCFDSLTGEFIQQIEIPQFGGRVFAVDFNKKGDVLYAVNGPSIHTDVHIVVQGFTLNATSGELIETWAPSKQGFHQPHDVISTSDNTAVYVVEIGPNHVWKFTTDAIKQPYPVEPKRSELPTIKKNNSSSKKDDQDIMTASEQDENRNIEPISPMPAIIITAVLLLPLIALLIAAIVRKVRSRRYITVKNLDNLPVLGHKRSLCPLNCCQTHYSFDKLQIDSDSDIDV